ncbi:MAG: alanine racemase [Acidimicrobiia bacterium]|nr:alanine racemase [Acidimicrobiia bacterium]
MRPTSCEIDLGAVARNVRFLREMVAPTPFCAVVKANGYGHGSVQVAETALEAGASWLAVATIEEGVELREAGMAAPILLLSEPPLGSMPVVAQHRLVPTLYSPAGIAAMADAAPTDGRFPVQLAVDTGMRRVGAEAGAVQALIETISSSVNLELDGVWTHCPVADEPENPFTDEQLETFDRLVDSLPDGVSHHVANSAAAITRPTRPGAMARFGIAMYGIDPSPDLAGKADLEPSLRLTSSVSFVKPIRAGEGVGYGHRWTASVDTTIATLPIGYADGVRRDLGLRGGSVLIGGVPRPIRGVVTMDQLMVDVGESPVSVGDEAVLIGRQGESVISAADVAATLDTIPYEVVCAIGARVPRVYKR